MEFVPPVLCMDAVAVDAVKQARVAAEQHKRAAVPRIMAPLSND
jgi:hypothetical protein